MGDRIKRLLAAWIDWLLSLLPAFIPAIFGSLLMRREAAGGMFFVFFSFAVALGGLVAFVLRDAIFRGRSVGKRLFGLYVVDEEALQPVRGKPAALKNILNLVGPLLYVDALCLLITGKTLGERISKTAVLSQKTLQAAQAGESETQQPGLTLKFKHDGDQVKSSASWPKHDPSLVVDMPECMGTCGEEFVKFTEAHPEIKEMRFYTEPTEWEEDENEEN